ncbi:unnamed protein product [Menidia menidia]|uniref:Gypsy retrotransposon integrase-like protein 1 n=1 Tax=Menidia menidia TaxID=238744 RepID=A0A8S4AQS4_9TELE|nr:unnamed protein product [Menidia menidia]
MALMDCTGHPTSFVRGVVEGTEVPMLVDSGASVSLISADFRMSVPALRNRPMKRNFIDSRAINGQMLDTLGTCEITFRLGPTNWQHTFHVLRESTQCVLLGLDFLAPNCALLDWGQGVLQLWDVSVPLLQTGELVPSCCNVSLADVWTIPPLSEALVPVNILTPAGTGRPAADFEGYLEPNIPDTTGLVVARSVNSVRNGVTSARILNPTGEAVELKRGLHLGEFYPLKKDDIVVPPHVADHHPTVPPAAVSPVSLEESPVTAEQRARLADLLQRDGARHKNADALSRRPVSPDPVDPNAPATGPVTVASLETSDHSPSADVEAESLLVYSLCGGGAELQSLQREDPDIGTVLAWLEQGKVRRPRKVPRDCSAGLRKLWTEFHRLSVMEGLLCRTVVTDTTGQKRVQTVVPASMVPELLQQLHGGPAAAHFSAERVWEKARQSCYWPFMLRDIRRWCEQCRACQTRRSPVPGPKAPMGGAQVSRPLQRVAADILELPMTSRGNRYILVVEDYFTKFVSLYALPNQTAHSVARCLFEDYVLVHGVPEILHSDQGRQFEAEVIQILCQRLGIKKTRTTAYNPKSDGMVERHNRTLIDQLAKLLLSHGGEWDTYVKHVAFAYNTSKHSSTRFTPFYLMHGREARVPADVLVPASAPDFWGTGSLMDYASTIAERLESAFSTARLNSAEAHERQKLYHDQSSCHRPYMVGALVWLNNPPESRMKLAPHWKGPYRVVQVLASGGESALTYRIVSALDPMERAQVVHHDRLKLYTLPLPAQAVPTPAAVRSPLGVESSLPQHGDQPQTGEMDNGLCGTLPELQSRSGRVVRPPSHLQDFVRF